MSYLILREIGMIERCLNTIGDIEFKEMGLAKGQYLFLQRVCENPGINQERLSELLKVDKSTTAKALKKMIEQGHVMKNVGEKDKREFNIYPTKQGEKIFSYLTKEEEYSTNTALFGLTKKEVETVHELLKKMRINVEKDWDIIKRGEKRRYLCE